MWRVVMVLDMSSWALACFINVSLVGSTHSDELSALASQPSGFVSGVCPWPEPAAAQNWEMIYHESVIRSHTFIPVWYVYASW